MDQPASGQPDAPEFETRTFGDVVCIRGDCLAILPRLQKTSVDMAFFDLPYGVTNCRWDKTPFPLAKLNASQSSLLKPSAVRIYSAVQPFTTSLITSMSDFRYDMTWHRKAPRGFQTANKRPMRAHETILIFGSPKGTYNPQKIKAARTTCYTAYTRSSEVYGGKPRATEKVTYRERHPTTLLSFDESDLRHDTLNGHISKRLHPTQKPVALLEWLIRTYTNDGDTILDPVAGSGTTAIAAMNVGGGRKVICIEKDPIYFEVMCKRIAEHQAKLTASASNPV